MTELTHRLAAERDRARRLRAVTSALSTAALGLVVSLALPWAVSTDEHEGFDPRRTLQLDEPGPWRADGWFLLRDAVGGWGQEGAAATTLLTVVPLLAAAVAGWALVRQDRGAAAAARAAGAVGLVVLLILGLRFLDGPALELGAGFWLAVGLCAVVAAAGLALDRALRGPADAADATDVTGV
jgi:hypothetical protein